MTNNEPPTSTPWGTADYIDQIAEGIYRMGTPSHGGIWLSRERAAQVPANYKQWADKWAKGKQRYSGEWYEEDCCALAVVVTFPDLFPQSDIEKAQAMIERYME